MRSSRSLLNVVVNVVTDSGDKWLRIWTLNGSRTEPINTPFFMFSWCTYYIVHDTYHSFEFWVHIHIWLVFLLLASWVCLPLSFTSVLDWVCVCLLVQNWACIVQNWACMLGRKERKKAVEFDLSGEWCLQVKQTCCILPCLISSCWKLKWYITSPSCSFSNCDT